MARITDKNFYEIKPGLPALSYLVYYGLLTRLSRRSEKFDHRMFGSLASAIDRHCFVEGQFERGVLEILRDLVQETGHTKLMVDVGANIGNHSIGLADLFERTEAVEPHPVIFRLLEANVISNNIGTINCRNFGLANENSSGELVGSSEHHGLARIKERSVLSPEVFGLDSSKLSASYSVELRDAAEFLKEFSGVLDNTFIKIDVEGMEEEIVSAIMPLLEDNTPIVGFEWFVKEQPDLEAIARSAKGYSLYGIVPHDHGNNLLWRAFKILVRGRTYSLEKLEPGKPFAPVYPLALMVPEGRLMD